KNDTNGESFGQVINPLKSLDSSTVFAFMHQLEQSGKFANAYFKARFSCINIFFKQKYHQYQSKNEMFLLNEAALNKAYETGDDHLIAFVSFYCGTNSLDLQEMELAATYLLKSQDLYDRFDP